MRDLVAALDAPVVQLWGWAGTGKRAVLDALLAEEPEAEFLPAAWLAEPERLEDRLRRENGRRGAWLVCRAQADSPGLTAAAALLHPGQRLLVAAERRLEPARESLATPPESLLLRHEEIGELWHGTAGRAPTDLELERLHEQSGGWLLPLALWASEAASSGGRLPDGERALWDPLGDFLRTRVIGCLEREEAALVLELGKRGAVPWHAFVGAPGAHGRGEVLRRMMERWALPCCRDGELRLPSPLAGFAAAESRRLMARAPGAPAVVGGCDAATGEDGGETGEESGPDVRIGLLGLPRVERRDPATGRMLAVQWSFKRPLRILAYLASAPDLQASREEVISILWPEANEDAIRRNLHPAVSWLRRSLWPGSRQGRVVLLRDGIYSLDPSLRWEVDVRVFLERVEEGARHLARGREQEAEGSWEAAWRLYQGAFLQGWSDRWILAQRDELQLRFTDLLRRLGDLKIRLGRLGEAEDAYRTLLLEDPLEEGVHVAIMRVYAARGRRDLVNRQYQRLRQVLLQELAVEPSPPTLDVFNELMR